MRFGIRNYELGIVMAVFLTACTDYSQNFEDDFGYAKSGKGVEFSGSTLKDLRDDNVYRVAKVNNIYWMMQDLAYEYYNSEQYGKTYCPESDSKTCNSTGWLYPGEHLDNVCPDGWRLPSYQEWYEFYNSSVFRSQKETILYNGKLGGDGVLDFKGENAYYWLTNDYDYGSLSYYGGGYKACALISRDGDIEGNSCHQQWKISVRCVKDVGDSDYENDQSDDGRNLSNLFDCSVTDGVKVVYPAGGESFKIGDEITVIYGSSVDCSGYRFVFKVDEEDIGMDLFDQSMGHTGMGDGKTCYEQKVKLSKDVVGKTSKGIIRVIPYENSKKGANSGVFKID
ncbi:MAG: hypothetical protein IKN03_03840 [Fibrobacter sp.]|nr:hypothetical protein [Fibrobacter sp.]